MKREQEKLLSIGTLSKQTGVHIKSLRYYDRLGILKPAYVDPNSGYRYYNFHQIAIVDAIQFCVELGIPLKNFKDYLGESSHQLYYAKLVESGTALAEEKIRTIQNRLAELKRMRSEIIHSEAVIQSNDGICCQIPEINLWLMPCSDKEQHVSAQEFQNIMQGILKHGAKDGIKAGYYLGRLLYRQGEEQKLFSYVNVELPEDCTEIFSKYSNIVHLPAGEYFCRKGLEGDILHAEILFPEQFAQNQENIVLESELMLGDYNYLNPPYELRCLLSVSDA